MREREREGTKCTEQWFSRHQMSGNKEQWFLEEWKSKEMKLVNKPLTALRQRPGLSAGKGRLPELRGGDRTKAAGVQRMEHRRECRRQKEVQRHAKGSPWDSVNNCSGCAREETTWGQEITPRKVRGASALFSPAIPKNKLQGTSVEDNEAFLPGWWEQLTPARPLLPFCPKNLNSKTGKHQTVGK